MPTILFIAGIYNLLWGALVVLFPHLFFDIFSIPRLNYPEIWQCVGMIVGVYGIGYLIASTNPSRHWPIVLVGLLGKIAGPIGFCWSVYQGAFPPSFILLIICNDLIWLYPFCSLLNSAYKDAKREEEEIKRDRLVILKQYILKDGDSLFEASMKRSLLLVFLRHAGCTFCRKSLDELSQALPQLKAKELYPVIIHLGKDNSSIEPLLERYHLSEIPVVPDPTQKLYTLYSFRRGNPLQLFGPRIWLLGYQNFQRYGIGALSGDGFQLGGAIVLSHGEETYRYPAKDAADIPPFCDMPSA